jgi:C4-dicarboxylate-specific signal transduction histidine kinase
LAEAEARSRRSQQPELAALDAERGHYTVVQAGEPASFALRVDLARLPPWSDWPMARDGPVRLVLRHGGQQHVVQAGAPPERQPVGLTAGFLFSKTLATPSQAFEVQVQQATGPAQWPWAALAAWALASALALAGLAAWRRAAQARRQAEDRLRVSQVARLNTLGELAAGLAHELNQPLAALSAQAQAARRLLEGEGPDLVPEAQDLAQARQALTHTVTQAKRAADVVARLRRLVAPAATTEPAQAVALATVAQRALALLGPELAQAGVGAQVRGDAPPVRADPVALEQIVHNLVSNALHALQQVAPAERRLWLNISHDAATGQGQLCVADNGPGMAPDDLHRVFLPFFSTRPGGLGLGLSLCDSLAQAQGGQLRAAQRSPRGAEFHLSLPLAHAVAGPTSTASLPP